MTKNKTIKTSLFEETTKGSPFIFLVWFSSPGRKLLIPLIAFSLGGEARRRAEGFDAKPRGARERKADSVMGKALGVLILTLPEGWEGYVLARAWVPQSFLLESCSQEPPSRLP